MVRDLVGVTQGNEAEDKSCLIQSIRRILCKASHTLYVLMYEPTNDFHFYPHKILLQKLIPFAFNKIQKVSTNKAGMYRNYLYETWGALTHLPENTQSGRRIHHWPDCFCRQSSLSPYVCPV